MTNGARSRVDGSEAQLFGFGDFELDLGTEELRRGGHRVPVAPKPFLVLRLLVTRAGRLVTREDLHEGVWGGAHLKLDESINFSIREVRRALGDDVKSPRFIQTVPRRGYRFIAPVAVRDSPAPSADVESPATRRLAVPAAIALGLTLVVAVVITAPSEYDWTTPESGAAAAEPATEQARELYWRATYLRSQGDVRALQALEQVVAAESTFAPAYVDLAGLVLFDGAADARTRSLGRWAAERGVQLAPKSPRAHRALADWYLWREWYAAEALAHYEVALELEPTDATTHHRVALLWIIVGERERALEHLTRARAEDPLSSVMQADLGWAYAALRRYDLAVSTCRDVVELEPASQPGWGCLLVSYQQTGLWDSAAGAARELARLQEAPDTLLKRLAVGPPRQAARRLAEWRYRTVARRRPMMSAMLAAELGDATAVEHWLRQAVERRDPHALAVSTDPRFDPFRSASWFQSMTRALPTLGG